MMVRERLSTFETNSSSSHSFSYYFGGKKSNLVTALEKGEYKIYFFDTDKEAKEYIEEYGSKELAFTARELEKNLLVISELDVPTKYEPCVEGHRLSYIHEKVFYLLYFAREFHLEQLAEEKILDVLGLKNTKIVTVGDGVIEYPEGEYQSAEWVDKKIISLLKNKELLKDFLEKGKVSVNYCG